MEKKFRKVQFVLFDSTSNIIGLAGNFFASNPPDREHPYGHQKYETVASLVIALILEVEGVKGCHKIRTRGSMGDIKVDMHLLVQSDMPLEDAHLVSHRVSKKLKERYKDVSDLVVHLEPCSQGPFSQDSSLQQPQESNSKKTS